MGGEGDLCKYSPPRPPEIEKLRLLCIVNKEADRPTDRARGSLFWGKKSLDMNQEEDYKISFSFFVVSFFFLSGAGTDGNGSPRNAHGSMLAHGMVDKPGGGGEEAPCAVHRSAMSERRARGGGDKEQL